jgi:hypothetical protein
MKRLSFITLIFLFLLAACGPATTATPVAPALTKEPTVTPTATPVVLPTTIPGTLSVNPSIPLGPISPFLFGTNYGPGQAVVLDVMPLVEQAGFTILRYPGGATTDNMDVQPFQVDQFMAFCKQTGSAPMISVRLLGGTPEAAAKLVRYTNIEKKYGVVYWSIGNEPSIYSELKYADYDYTTENLNRDWRPIAEAMKAVDPTIKLVGPEIHQWNSSYATTPKDSAGRDWMTEFLKVNGDLIDVVSVHRYPLHAPTNPVTIQDLRENTKAWNAEVDYLRNLTIEILGHELPIAITELNSDPSAIQFQEASPDSFYNAIWYADVLGQLMNSDVFMVNQWVISQRSTGLGLFKGSEVRPTYYVFPLYKNFGNEQVFASSGVPYVDVFAAKRADGALTLMVINLTDLEQIVPMQVAGGNPTEAEVWLIDATHNSEDLGVQPFTTGENLVLPAQSATLFIIK